MVFSSVPMFLDPPNWSTQQPNHHLLQGSGCEITNNTTQQHLPPPPPPPPPTAGGGPGSNIRPGSMTDRARMAKIPQPEAGLKCPRCESANTKFCYFNNYSLTQPRHFCKTCRRYWTRGGAMRNVPVGGGCRRSSKRSSSNSKGNTTTNNNNNRSKSPGGCSSSTSTSTVSSNSCTTADILSHQIMGPPPPSHFPFLSPNDNFGNIGLNFEALQIPSSSSNSITEYPHQWKVPSFFANLHQQNGIYSSFMADQADFSNYQRLSKPLLLETGIFIAGPDHHESTQPAAGINNNFSTTFLGIQPTNDQFWNNSTTTSTTTPPAGWTTNDQISDHHFNSTSSTTHLL